MSARNSCTERSFIRPGRSLVHAQQPGLEPGQHSRISRLDVFGLNGEAFSMDTMKPTYTVHEGRRYRLKLRNASDDIHPLHLHRHSFELTRVGGKATTGVMKDVVMLGGFQELEFDFVADNPGPTLFHCHQQLHMDFGFMALFNYA